MTTGTSKDKTRVPNLKLNCTLYVIEYDSETGLNRLLTEVSAPTKRAALGQARRVARKHSVRSNAVMICEPIEYY